MNDPLNQPQVHLASVETLVPYVNNARTHSDEQVAQIAASIKEFGWTTPLLVDGENGILAGHGRLAAARKLGITEVPVIELSHLSAQQKKAYILADNRLALNAGWDEELLKLELSALAELDFDLDLIGFTDKELDALLGADESAGLTDDDAVPEVPVEPVSKPGDLWVLGEHRIYCGDATHAESYEKLLAGQRVQLIWSDLPYNVNYANSAKDKMRGKSRPILNDNLGENFYQFVYDSLSMMLPVCDGAVYIAMSSSELDTLQAAFRAAGGKWSTFIIWAKHTFTLGRADYQRQYEPILYGWPEGRSHHWCGDRDQSDVWEFKKPAKNDLHPTMKPVELVERSILNSSQAADVVLDCFGGSGSTLIAAHKTGRRCFMMELDPKYCDVIVRRAQEFSGIKALLDGDGRSFDEVQGVEACSVLPA